MKQRELQRKKYSGKTISLNFQNIKVRAVLQLLAEFTGLNIVVSDNVKGEYYITVEECPLGSSTGYYSQNSGF